METQNSFDLIEFLSKSFHCLCRNVNFADKINFLFLLKSTWEYHSNNAAWMIKEVFISFDQPYLFTSWSLSLWNKLCINCQVFSRKNFVHNASKGGLVWKYIMILVSMAKKLSKYFFFIFQCYSRICIWFLNCSHYN